MAVITAAVKNKEKLLVFCKNIAAVLAHIPLDADDCFAVWATFALSPPSFPFGEREYQNVPA